MKIPCKKTLFTVLADWIDSIIDSDSKKPKSPESYPYRSSISNRWGKSDVIFGPIEVEIYHQLKLLNGQKKHCVNLQLNKVELIVDTVQYQHVMDFLLKEFSYQDSKNFDKANLAQLIDREIFSLDIYQHIGIKTNPNIEFIIHAKQGDQGHLLENAQIHIYETKIDLSLSSVHTTSPQHNSSDNNCDNSNSKKVQICIYDEKSDRRIHSISIFPAILGVNSEIGLYGRYVSREHIELDFNVNDELIVRNISKTNPIFVNAEKLNKVKEIEEQPSRYIISESVVNINDKIHIGKIANNEQENKLYPIVEIKKIRLSRAGSIPPIVDDSINVTPTATPYSEVPITPFPNNEQLLFKLSIIIHGVEKIELITSSQLPCLIGRFKQLSEDSVYRKLITIPSYYEGIQSTVSREHLIIDNFQDGAAQIKVLGKNGCFINNVKQPSNFSLNSYCKLQLGLDNPPVVMELLEVTD